MTRIIGSRGLVSRTTFSEAAGPLLRGDIGLYYDHPLLAIAFNSDIADAAQQQQAVLTAGSPSPTAAQRGAGLSGHGRHL